MNPVEHVRANLGRDGKRWHKGSLDGPGESMCLIGACMSALTRLAIGPIVEVVGEQYPDRVRAYYKAIPSFNDHPDTTWADVERVLDKASARWDEEHGS
jgi:hypothetical protein